MIMPLNGTNTHPLSPHARSELASLDAPRPTQQINPGVINRLMRDNLIEIVSLPSPYASHRGRPIQHAVITAAGRAVLQEQKP